MSQPRGAKRKPRREEILDALGMATEPCCPMCAKPIFTDIPAEMIDLRQQLQAAERERDRLANLVRDANAYYVAAESRERKMREALEAIAIALKEPDGGEYWTARKFLDNCGIFHDDLNDLRVLSKVASAALLAAQKEEGKDGPNG